MGIQVTEDDKPGDIPQAPLEAPREAEVGSNLAPHCFASALAAACWKLRRTSLASLFGKFERCTIST